MQEDRNRDSNRDDNRDRNINMRRRTAEEDYTRDNVQDEDYWLDGPDDSSDEEELEDEIAYEIRRRRRQAEYGRRRGARRGREDAEFRDEERRRRMRRGGGNQNNWLYIVGIFLCIAITAAVLAFAGKRIYGHFSGAAQTTEAGSAQDGSDTQTGDGTADTTEETTTQTALETLLAQADKLAAQYDYDSAIALLQGDKAYASDAQVTSKIQEYETTKGTLVEQDIADITHVFFHILVVDPARTFTDTKQGKGYNSVMTTVDEFEKILQQMYDRGYVLVRLHDMAEIQTDAQGNQVMVKKPILLPEGKKPFVMSQDDVNYYEYMVGSGCPDKLLLDENGKITAEYTDADGNVTTGDYDLVPILDRFVEEHPDFSYKGAKAVLALTGYNGVLGYRTDETYDASSPNYDAEKTANPNIEADKETVKKLTQALKDDGYEFASHSWGHRDYGQISIDHLKTDADRWEKNVEPLLPDPCDILIFPFGSDIGDWHAYADDNERYQYLEGLGFRYFCNVDASSPHWVQLGSNYLRQGRRNLDGYRLWMDYSGADNRLSDLMDVKQVFDTRRPTPIDWQ